VYHYNGAVFTGGSTRSGFDLAWVRSVCSEHLCIFNVYGAIYNFLSLHPFLPFQWQNWMAAYLGYTLRMKTLFHDWPVTVNHLMTCIREEEEWWDWWDLPLSAWDVKPYYTYHTYQRWSIILGVSTMDDVMWEKYAPKTPPKVAWVANFKTSKHMSQYLQKYYSDQL